MFDTMTFTKVLGSFCGALLIFLLGQWAAELLYHTGGGYGDDYQQGYVIETGADDEAEEVVEEGPSFEELYASADLGKGERVFNKCKACHKLDEGANGTGPYLHGVVGRDVAAAEGFGYSGSLVAVADVWTPQELSAFLENPASYAPGTTMGFAGLGKIEDRVNVIAYLDQTDGDMTTLEVPAAEEEAAAEPAAEEGAATEMAQADPVPAQDEETAAEEVTAEEPVTTEAEGTPAAEAEAAAATDTAGGSDFAGLVAAADPADGEKLWRGCRACHKLDDGANGVGPHLYGIVDRDIASVDGFRYSKSLEELEGAWTVDELNAWLEDPKAYAPGNKMSYRGMKKEDDRAALIKYMQTAAE
ncbi:cytochrome c family protein [Roseovarius gahaiensis]|uniref:Cytochrome c family protein n=2 Tax=Roseovarius gahaiensis TaxID=2716691 RepID=A0A967BCX8_9RHOB|nr:cytochrome c family protein [Roseovarius gahaiensis]